MSFCNNCIHRDRDCVIDPPESDVCAQYKPTLLKTASDNAWLENIKTATQIPPSRGTTVGELTRMHVESENPDHYKTGGIECIDALRDALGHDGFIAYCRGQIIRYAWRIGKKDECLVEALKLEKYANWLVDEFNGKELRK